MEFIVMVLFIGALVFGSLMISRALFSDEDNEKEFRNEEKTPCTMDDYTYHFNLKK